MEVVPIASGIHTATTEVQRVELLKHVQQDIPITMEIATRPEGGGNNEIL